VKNFILFIFLCISAKSFGGIYQVQDNENNCKLLFSEDSKFSKEIDITTLKRRSIAPALVFQKSEEKYNVKGLWSLLSLERDVVIKEAQKQNFMENTFKSICINDKREIIHTEIGRKLFNNLNDLDRE
jgi:hypothetical protein